MSDGQQLLLALAGVFITTYFMYWRMHPLYPIPTLGGPSLPLFSYIGAKRYRSHAKGILTEGYQKYKVFKVAMIDQWLVVVSGSKMNEELRQLPDTHASFTAAVDELSHAKYSLAPNVNESPIHIAVIRGPLTRNLNLIFADVVDETNLAFNEVLPSPSDGWVSVSVLKTMGYVVSRASNRVFVGIPLCRNPAYLQVVLEHAWNFTKARDVMNVTPGFLTHVVGPMLPWVKRTIRKASVYLAPLIEERMRKLREMGDEWTDKPNDLLMWLVEEGKSHGLSTNIIVQATIVTAFAAIHTSSNSITHALYHLAASPEFVGPLREEIEAVIKEHGWTKLAIGKMRKLDSFMRESQRVNGVSGISIQRKILQDVTLSDGTFLPKGVIVAGAANATHSDVKNYENPNVFDPFRFSSMRLDDKESIKHQYVTTSSEYIGFGHGKHACPGRFFAANELKVMMALIVLNYDLKFENGNGRPENRWVYHTIRPSEAKVVFKKRGVQVVN